MWSPPTAPSRDRVPPQTSMPATRGNARRRRQAVRPIALRHVMEIARACPGTPVSGMGGIESAAAVRGLKLPLVRRVMVVGLRDPEHARAGPMAGAIFETAVLAEIRRRVTRGGGWSSPSGASRRSRWR